MPETARQRPYRRLRSSAVARSPRLLFALMVLISVAACTGTTDGAVRGSNASASAASSELPVLPTFVPPLAFDPTAETPINLGPMVGEGSRLIPRTTVLLDNAMVTVVEDGLRRYRAADAAEEWMIQSSHEPRPDGRGSSVGVASLADDGPRLLAVSFDFVGVPPGGGIEAAGSEIAVADVDSGEELWRVEIFPPEAENTSSPLYGSNTLSYVVDVTEDQVVLGYGSATVVVGPDGVIWSAFGPAPSFVDADVVVTSRNNGTSFRDVDRDLVGLDLATGALRWEFVGESAEQADAAGAGIAVANALGADGVFAPHWIDTSNGAVLAPIGELAGQPIACFETVGAVVYCLFGPAGVVALDGATRTVLWSTEVSVTAPDPQPFLRVAGVAGGAVYIDVEAQGSDLPILDAGTGELLGTQDHHVRSMQPWGALCDMAPMELDEPAGFHTLCPAIDLDDPPSPAPNPSTGREEPGQLGPDELPMPVEARERTVDGAQAFARYFVDIVGHAFESGQTEHFEALSRNCATCERQIATVIQNSAEGIRSTNAEVLAFSIEPFEMYGTRALLEVTASFGPEGYVDVNGNPIPDRGSQGAESLRATVILTWVAELQSWIVDGDAGFRRP